MPQSEDVTGLLKQLSGGKQEVVNQLVPILYAELHRLASHYVRRERGDHTLQATALVHEAYLRLVDQKQVEWKNRSHFFGIAAQQMRRILVDYGRAHQAAKRGGGVANVSLEQTSIPIKEQAAEVLAIDELVSRLSSFDPQQARIVELRFFGGLTEEETADALGVSTSTIKREWTVAKAWFNRELGGEKHSRSKAKAAG